MILKLSNTSNNINLLTQYLCEVDNDFEIPLSSRTELKIFSLKLLLHGHVFFAIEKKQAVGLVAFYCNNYEIHQAYIPILSVKQNYRSKGYARQLINIAINVCRLYKMNTISVDSINPIAITLYKSVGFKTYKTDDITGMTKEYMTLNIPQITVTNLLTFLQEINSEYVPNLDKKVGLSDYVDKILTKASFLIECDKNGIVGLVVFYCNNINNLKAYIPLVGVLPRAQHQGIATRMMEIVCQYIKEQKFKVIGIHSNNPIAIKAYQKLGFRILNENERKYLEKII